MEKSLVLSCHVCFIYFEVEVGGALEVEVEFLLFFTKNLLYSPYSSSKVVVYRLPTVYRKMSKATDRQKNIYINGMSGRRPLIPTDAHKLRQKARERMTTEAYAYIAGGAGREDTIVANRSGFDQWKIVPRMLRDVSERDTSLTLFGQSLSSPFLLAPIGVLEMAHRRADRAVAQAAKNTRTPMIFSNQASVSMESCARILEDSPHWFQLYWSKSDDLVASLAKRAEDCGCSAIVVTLDTTLLGWRNQDLDLAHLPFLHGKGIAQYTSDPVFNRLLNEKSDTADAKTSQRINPTTLAALFKLAWRFPGRFTNNLTSGIPLKSIRKFIEIYSRPSLTWKNIAFLRERTSLPILLKGILHTDDALQALRHGINGIIVSNHGGRQVDGAISTIEALPGIVKAVNGQIPVLLDSGIRGGSDAFKALALGATAVCIGRPYVYALTLAGSAGVEELVKNYQADFELTMALAGCKSLEEINRNSLTQK